MLQDLLRPSRSGEASSGKLSGKLLKDAGTTGQDDGTITIIRSKWTVARCPGHGPSPDNDGTVWAVVEL